MPQSPIIAEDGSMVANANSFVSIPECEQFLLDRGLVEEPITVNLASLIIRAMDVLLNECSVAPYTLPLAEQKRIPNELKLAQLFAVTYILRNPEIDQPGTGAPSVKRERVEGAVEVEYFGGNAGAATDSPISRMIRVKEMLSKLPRSTECGYGNRRIYRV